MRSAARHHELVLTCRRRLLTVAAAMAMVVTACGSGEDVDVERSGDTAVLATPSTQSSTTTTSTTTDPGPVVIGLRLERQATDGTDGFEEMVRATLTDAGGWAQAGFEFRFADDAPYRILLAEAAVVDATCLPYDTGGRFSCQIGPTVALNADRWREATDTWTGTLDDYRRMLVNHEVGHLLGRHHVAPGYEADAEATCGPGDV